MNGIENNYLAPSGLNGLKNELGKNAKKNKYTKFKIILLVLTTNLFVYLLNSQDKNENLIHLPKPLPSMHANYELISIYAECIITNENLIENLPVSIVDEQNKTIINDAYFRSKELVSKSNENEEKSIFKIEIPRDEIIQLTSKLNQRLVIIPHQAKHHINNFKKGNSYEIHF